VTPPSFLFLTINSRCNLRCVHCRYWQSNSKSSLGNKLLFIKEFATFAAPNAAVVICGGESTLDYAEYMQVAKACRDSGVRCLSVINGTTVKSAERALELVERGPTEISVSIDSHDPEQHDAVRGVHGSHALAIRALRLLLEARKGRTSPKLYVMAVVSERNYRDLDRFYDFMLNDVGVDKLKLNFLQPTFGNGGLPDPYFAKNYIQDPDQALRVIEGCSEKYALKLSPEWLSVVRTYLTSVVRNKNAMEGWVHRVGTSEPICNSYDRNIMIDEGDTARLCFNWSFPGKRIQPGQLRQFWETADWRERMAQCRLYCGISHSVRRVSAHGENVGKIPA
jgi:MoaA/NifB/PqqE/SkfB family radical SAM enzyme